MNTHIIHATSKWTFTMPNNNKYYFRSIVCIAVFITIVFYQLEKNVRTQFEKKNYLMQKKMQHLCHVKTTDKRGINKKRVFFEIVFVRIFSAYRIDEHGSMVRIFSMSRMFSYPHKIKISK